MFSPAKPSRKLSQLALAALCACVVGAVALSIADGVLEDNLPQISLKVMTWVRDFRYLFGQGIYTAAVFWVGASLIETRTLLGVGFDRLDADSMSVKGPDEANTVWVGRRYGARLEAEAVAAALESRLQDTQVHSSDK